MRTSDQAKLSGSNLFTRLNYWIVTLGGQVLVTPPEINSVEAPSSATIVCQGDTFTFKLAQKERIDTLTVPYKVIREAALNILIHRTWWSYGAVLSVAIFDDRVEFANPGAFPPGTSPETFYKRPQSKPINKLISEVFFKSGLMEAWGRGIPDIFDLCKENGLPKPEFELANGYVYLTIRFKESLTPRLSGGVSEPQNEPLNGPLNETLNQLPTPVKAVYDAVKANPGIRRAGIVAHTGLNLPAVKRAITVLLSKELIEHRGSDKTGGYYVI